MLELKTWAELVSVLGVIPTNAKEGQKSTFNEVNKSAVKYGVIVESKACNSIAKEWLKTYVDGNFNATFYKTYSDVVSKIRFELLLDQILHYMTTYGTGHSLGNDYVPNDDPMEIPMESFKFIKGATVSEINEMILTQLKSGIALKDETVRNYVMFLSEYGKDLESVIDEIKNRQAVIEIADKLGIYPKNPDNLFRVIMFKITGSSQLVKDKKTLSQVATSSTFDFSKLNELQMNSLATLYLRNSELFAAIHHGSDAESRRVLNKIRKYAKKLHKPMRIPFWNQVLATEVPMGDIMDQIENLTPYKMVSLIKAINSRLDSDKEFEMYVIRNGKYFYKSATKSAVSKKYLKGVKTILWNKLIEIVNSKDMPHTFVSAGQFRIAMPTSEKNFVGDTPIGSYIDLSDVEEAILGIYWKNEWGQVRDYDLHFQTLDGTSYGWNTKYYDSSKSICFSGDMTNAEPEAAELFWIKSLKDNLDIAGVFSAEDYTHLGKSKFRLFVAIPSKDGEMKLKTKHGSFAVNPNDVLMRADIPTDYFDKPETQCALIFNKKLFITNLVRENRMRVPSMSINEVIKPIGTNLEYLPCIEDLLRDAGWEVVDDTDDESIKIGINFKDFKGIDLINLISKN